MKEYFRMVLAILSVVFAFVLFGFVATMADLYGPAPGFGSFLFGCLAVILYAPAVPKIWDFINERLDEKS